MNNVTLENVEQAVRLLLDGLHDIYVLEPTEAALRSAIQKAVDAGGGTVLLPACGIIIHNTLLLKNAKGVTLRGHGMANPHSREGCSYLHWLGPADDVMLDMSGTSFCTVENIGFYAGSGSAGSSARGTAIRIRGNAEPGLGGSFHNTIENCYFQNWKTSIAVGEKTDQADTLSIRKCFMYYDSTVDGVVGIRINSANSLKIAISECTLTGLATAAERKAVGVFADSGSIECFSLTTANNHAGILFDGQPTGISTITGFHSESDNYALVTRASGTPNDQKANPLTVIGIYAYHCLKGFMLLEHSNMAVTILGGYVQPSGGDGTIRVAPNYTGLWLINVTYTASPLVAGTLDTARINGWHGLQGPAARPFIA